CVAHDIGRIIIGQNKGWKQNLALGRRNNQNFAQVPLAQLVQMITYKAALAGIDITLVSEPYTSQASALDGDEIAKGHCTGRRLRQARKGGKTCRCNLYKRANGEYVHGDVNGAANIIRKAVPDAFAGGIKGIGLCPALVAIA
ncbi:MAG TPA: IS200/IS605 family accessory protein TnpB-related protein, partial [Candidatus Lokiarchaeia archaeon]|nr:IS200/IS605 family accessory protein TnpB-related protein [Candidatus Lokiarchaeia archaeon]